MLNRLYMPVGLRTIFVPHAKKAFPVGRFNLGINTVLIAGQKWMNKDGGNNYEESDD